MVVSSCGLVRGVRRGTGLIFSSAAIMGCVRLFVSASVCLCERTHRAPCSTWHSGNKEKRSDKGRQRKERMIKRNK